MPSEKDTNDAMAFMRTLAHSSPYRFVVAIPDGYAAAADAVKRRIADQFPDGSYVVLLGDESLLTDDYAQLVIYTGDADIRSFAQRVYG